MIHLYNPLDDDILEGTMTYPDNPPGNIVPVKELLDIWSICDQTFKGDAIHVDSIMKHYKLQVTLRIWKVASSIAISSLSKKSNMKCDLL